MNQGQMEIFGASKKTPLAHRLRPVALENLVGQPHIKKKISTLKPDSLPHLVFYGPPGCGKTTLAFMMAELFKIKLYPFNAVLGGVKDLRELINLAKADLNSGNKAIIFIDEIHRFNKAQQDALLPYLETGEFILLGATTENPNTSLNPAILSRIQKWRLEALTVDQLKELIDSACKDLEFDLPEITRDFMAKNTGGDARMVLNQIERLFENKERDLSDLEFIREHLIETYRVFDTNRHYDVISAFIKSVRGSDVDAALLWLAVMLEEGEDVEFIARRLIILASEDIGNADPRGLQIASSAHYSVKQIGMPEARIILAQATTYLALAPKSNASYTAIDKAIDFVRSNPKIEVPTHLRNHHPDKKNYLYPHSHPSNWVDQKYKPQTPSFYSSSQHAYEKMQDDFQRKVKGKKS